jgi:type IV secretory pathway TraG/TraD family ATPase VirD4
LKRANLPEKERTPFYLYVDEFQNVVTDTFAGMLSESRKYGLAVHLTNQYFAQLPEKIQDAILGNVGTLLSFEIGMEDAEKLVKEFVPFTTDDFINLQRYNYYIKLMINGKMSEAFSGVSLPPLGAINPDMNGKVRTINRVAYGFPKLLVEEQIKAQLR